MKQLWTDKYRPKTIDGYLFKDADMKTKILEWIDEQSIPHILLSGNAGVGKTTLAKILINQLNIDPNDILYANGSKAARKIEWVDQLILFCSTIPYGTFKVVLIDEADYMNPSSVQPALRALTEEYNSTVRFIFTCNYPNKIIPPLHSRCQNIHIEKSDVVEFTTRVASILVEENIEFDLETLDAHVKNIYPDLRKCINNIQYASIRGVLKNPNTKISGSEYYLEMIELFKQGKISEARKLICANVLPEEIEDIYRWLYDNIEIFGDERKQDSVILIIKQGLVDHISMSDPEINLASVMIKIARVLEK